MATDTAPWRGDNPVRCHRCGFLSPKAEMTDLEIPSVTSPGRSHPARYCRYCHGRYLEQEALKASDEALKAWTIPFDPLHPRSLPRQGPAT